MNENRVIIPEAPLHKELILPIYGLPQSIQYVIETVSSVYQCPRDFVVSAVFMAQSTIVGKRACSFDGKYNNYPSLWMVNVADSGSNKSQPVKWVINPLLKRDKDNYRLYSQQKAELKESLCQEKIDIPIFKQLIISDSTPEGRNKCLFQNPNGVILFRDELKGLLDDVGRYGRSGEISQLLSIFDNEGFSINRKNEEPILITDPFMNIYGSIQPDVLKTVFGSPLLMGNGFNQRWLFCYPNKSPASMYSKEVIPESCMQAWKLHIDGVDHFFNKFNASYVIYFDDAAKDAYVAYYNTLQRKKEEANSYNASIYSKLQIQVQRWATLVVIFNYQNQPLVVREDNMLYAIECMIYFERCAMKIYDQIQSEDQGYLLKNGELIAKVHQTYGIKNQTQFAESIGISQQSVSKFLKPN